MPTQPVFDIGVLCRYDSPGPRYTSYPTAPQFREDFGEEQLRRWAWRSNVQVSPRPISLYVHVPYCFSPCFYCGCNRTISRDPARGEHYVERLQPQRSEEHTSELQSRVDLVCRLLLEKKKKKNRNTITSTEKKIKRTFKKKIT